LSRFLIDVRRLAARDKTERFSLPQCEHTTIGAVRRQSFDHPAASAKQLRAFDRFERRNCPPRKQFVSRFEPDLAPRRGCAGSSEVNQNRQQARDAGPHLSA